MDTRSLSTSELLSVWERGLGEEPLQRALILLAAFCTEGTPEDMARLSIGQRDTLLLSMREEIFGPKFSGLASCPKCGEQLETGFRSEEIRATPSSENSQDLSVDIDGYVMHFHLPNTLDLMAVSGLKDLSESTQALLRRCLLEARFKGKEALFDELPEMVLDEAQIQMNELDPQADVQLNLTCPECGHNWKAAFDISSYLWKEIDVWALRTLNDVHVLASAYGWSEAEILAMSSWRRQVYLELVSP